MRAWRAGFGNGDGTWEDPSGYDHIVLTYDNSLSSLDGKLYLNGEIWGEGTQDASLDVGYTGIDFGRWENTSDNRVSRIDDAALFNHALTQTEVKAVMNLALADINYDVGQAYELFKAYAESEDVEVDGTQWYYRNDLEAGTAGDVVESGGDSTLYLAATEGMTTAAPPSGTVIVIR